MEFEELEEEMYWEKGTEFGEKRYWDKGTELKEERYWEKGTDEQSIVRNIQSTVGSDGRADDIVPLVKVGMWGNMLVRSDEVRYEAESRAASAPCTNDLSGKERRAQENADCIG